MFHKRYLEGLSVAEGISTTAAACKYTDLLEASVALLTADWPAWLPRSLSELLTDDVRDPPGNFFLWFTISRRTPPTAAGLLPLLLLTVLAALRTLLPERCWSYLLILGAPAGPEGAPYCSSDSVLGAPLVRWPPRRRAAA